ncbi:PAS domain-containing sensor histidine kinase [Hydrogenophaga borbori]|uniref:PAS domain-containing sensor histidine kinase n=2 Tax=Hydrogenophaga TaxID=47420 RepID=UPI00301CCA41
MSARLSPTDAPLARRDGEAGVSERERAMQLELRTLRAENEYLRQRYAQQLSGLNPAADASQPGLRADLPLSLVSALDADRDGRPAQAKLEFEALFAALASVFPIGVFRTDEGGLLTHIDSQLQQIFGLQREDFPNFGWLARVHPEDLERVQAAWVRGISRGESLNVEFRIVKPGNETVYVLTRNAPLRDASGRVVSQLGFVQDITPMRVLEAEARIKDELNRQIIASSPDCTKVLDLEGRVVQMTEQGCRLVEVDDFEEVRLSDWTTWWPDEGGTLARDAVAAARQGKGSRFVAFGNTFKGTPKWWDTALTPICDAQGQPAMLLAVSRDITELHQQQDEIRRFNAELEKRVKERTEELAEAKERVSMSLAEAQSLYNQAPCGYHSFDANGTLVLINRTELDWLGYERHEVIGKLNVRDMVPPGDGNQELVLERLNRLVAGEKLDPIETVVRRRDGSTFSALVSSTAVRDSKGRFLRSNNTLIDITALKAAQQALAAQSRFMQTISDNAPVQIAFFDRDLICRFANASYTRWREDRSHDSVVGLHLSEIADRKVYESVRERLSAALAGEPQRFEGERRFPGGEPYYASIEYIPFQMDGQVQGLIIQMIDITERKASEDRVSQANQRLARALEQANALYNRAPCGYHSLDIDGIFVSINDTELEWLGYTRDEVVGKLNFRDVIPPHQVPLLDSHMHRMLQDDALDGVEYEMLRRDGTRFYALVSSTTVRDAQGRFLRSNTTVVDITRRRAAEDALRRQQHFLQSITDRVPGLIAYLDADLHFRFANAEHLRVYGMDPQRIVGQHLSRCVAPDIWADIEPRMRGALAGTSQHFEAWRRMPDGTPIFMSANYLPDPGPDGKVRGVFVQIIDITERKRVEERVSHLNEELEQRIQERSAELLESEQRFRLMVDNLRDYCIFFLDANGFITDWTDSAQRMDGYSPVQMLGRHYGVLFDPVDEAAGRADAERMLRLAASRGQHDVQSWQLRKDGSRYWSHSVLIALRDQRGDLKGFAKINRDMTDAKQLDDLMRNINDELEKRVVERTEQLLAANRDLESFSYSVSHDLRSPLRHISSFVSLLEEHLGLQRDETTTRYLATIGNSARHMSQLIDGLLAFSRLGRAAVNIAPVDFNHLVSAVVSQLAHDTDGRVVDWQIASDLPIVHGDALLLREVWANLLGNAFKYTRPRERAVIGVSWHLDPVRGYTFSVRDNGVGFDTKYAQKLFGVFQRLHRASEFEGTGIGLALTRRIVERHGGSIWAESRLGEGSVFHFALPIDGPRAPDPTDSMPAPLEP